MRTALVMAAAFVVALPGVAQAQVGTRRPPARAGSPPPASDRVRILLSGGAQRALGSFHQSFTVMRNVEDEPVTTDLKVGLAGFFDAGVRIRVARRLSVGATGFFSPGSAAGSVDAKVPHPFYFNQPRDVSGDLSGLMRRESGVHIDLAYPAAVSRRTEVMLFGGPSYIRAEQGLVTNVAYEEVYPFDKATFTSATTTVARMGAAGFNVGVDATWRLSRATRAGALVRYSRADLTLSPASGNDVGLRAGGLHVGGTLQFVLGR